MPRRYVTSLGQQFKNKILLTGYEALYLIFYKKEWLKNLDIISVLKLLKEALCLHLPRPVCRDIRFTFIESGRAAAENLP